MSSVFMGIKKESYGIENKDLLLGRFERTWEINDLVSNRFEGIFKNNFSK